MRNPQVVNKNIDTVVTVDATNVINDVNQNKILVSNAVAIQVNIALLDISTNTSNSVTNIPMTYNSSLDIYTINVSDIVSILSDRKTYVGLITEYGTTYGMRPITIESFSTDTDGFEDTWMRLPYQVEISAGQAWIKWYTDISFTAPCKYKAQAYEGGVGTTYAILPERVTHRGPIVVGP